MIVLGISPIMGENLGASLVKDGKLIASVEEERFNRIKHSIGFPFPLNSIKYCLEFGKISLEELDGISVGGGSPSDYFRKQLLLSLRKPILLPTFKNWINPYLIQRKYKFFTDKRISYYLHHLSHASSCFHVSGFKESNIITMDGRGETESTLLGVGIDSEIKTLKTFNLLNSIGALYESFTDYLGFKRHSHEGHVMGLSSYGKPILDTTNLIKLKKDGYSCETLERYKTMLRFFPRKLMGKKVDSLNELLIKLYGEKRKREEPITKRHENIASTIQNIQEKVLIKLAENLYNQTNIKNFCLAGGSSLNCVANGILLEQDFVKDIFIQPASGDNGTSIGSAFLEYKKLTGKKIDFKMNHAYYGPEYSNEEILKEIKRQKLKYEEYSDISGKVAELLNNGKIVGWFQGRMEVGPRALGNRSILANPTIKDMKDKLNLQVKKRMPFRPFCPSLLDEVRDKYFETDYPSPFMILSFRVKKELWGEIPSVVHIDGTARPQTVERKYNKKYYDLIKSFGKLSGHPIVLNTSFNGKEEPIVCSPLDAINCMKKVNLDYLAIGDYLIKNG